jgi:predicted secreted hydrolase
MAWAVVAAALAAALYVATRSGVAPPLASGTPVLGLGRAGDRASEAAGFLRATPGRPYVFPRDHAAHPAYATEWWYYTGHLRDRDGGWYGYQLTFFRVGIAPPGSTRASAWATRNIYFAHFAITDEAHKTYSFRQRVSRGVLGEAGAETASYRVHIGDWSAALSGAAHVLNANGSGMAIHLEAVPTKPPAIHGENGISQKAEGAGHASYYYSLTRMATTGSLTLNGKTVTVSGTSWFDHEFGSNQLGPNQVGWDWFSLQMADGTEAMLYHMRDADGGVDPFSSGTLIAPNGGTTHLNRDDYNVEVLAHWKSGTSGGNYPSRWRVRIPSRGWDLILTPTVRDQEIEASGGVGVTYWEGSVEVKGSANGVPISGRGYVELTGYAHRFQQTF